MARINSKFYSHLKGEELRNFILSYKGGSLARQVLAEMLEGDLRALLKDEENPKRLKSQNWQLEQAYELGYRKALRYAIDLLTQEFGDQNERY